MRYKIALQHSEEGYSVSVPGLPGCWSEGATEHETIPRHNPINAITMGGIARDAGLTVEEFKQLL